MLIILEFITLIAAFLLVILFGIPIANWFIGPKQEEIKEYTSIRVRKME